VYILIRNLHNRPRDGDTEEMKTAQ